MLKAAIVGTGGAAWVGHLPWLWEHADVKLVATCALDRKDAQAAADRWEAERAYDDYEAMLASESLDFVVVATPPAMHKIHSIAALKHGCHVLCEKPLATSVAECDEIIAAAARHQRIVSVSHEKRFNPGLEKIKQLIDERLLGDVFYAVIHWSANVRLDPERLSPPDYRESYLWRWTHDDVGGGIIADHFPHYLDLWRWWLDSELASCTTEMENIRGDWIKDETLGGKYEDFGTVLMRFQNGAIGFFETGNAGRGISPIMHVGSGIGEWSEYGMLYGTRGHLIFDLLPWDSPELPRIMVYSLEQKQPDCRGWFQVELPDPWRAPGGPRSPKTNGLYSFQRQLNDFVAAIQNGRTPRVTAHDGRATIAGIEAAYESARTNQKVHLD